jgi:hypothetical protein
MRYRIVTVLLWFAACSPDKKFEAAGENQDGRDETSSVANSYTDSDTGSSGPSDSDTGGDTGTPSGCPDGSVLYTTKGGKNVCCGERYPVFCDENEAGYEGGCWSPGADCETIVYCNERWIACPEGTLSACPDGGDIICYRPTG